MPVTIEARKSKIIPMTAIFLVEDFIRYKVSLSFLLRYVGLSNVGFMNSKYRFYSSSSFKANFS